MNTKKRIESGAVQFDDDWPGVFIRGDDAAYLYTILEDIVLKDTAATVVYGWKINQLKGWIENAIGQKPGISVASSKPLNERKIQKVTTL